MKSFIVLDQNYGNEIKEEDMGGDITCMGGQKNERCAGNFYISGKHNNLIPAFPKLQGAYKSSEYFAKPCFYEY
jgi:hypothetical protein